MFDAACLAGVAWPWKASMSCICTGAPVRAMAQTAQVTSPGPKVNALFWAAYITHRLVFDSQTAPLFLHRCNARLQYRVGILKFPCLEDCVGQLRPQHGQLGLVLLRPPLGFALLLGKPPFQLFHLCLEGGNEVRLLIGGAWGIQLHLALVL